MSKFDCLKILVCGEVCVDRYIDNVTYRQSPEADVPIVTEVTGAADERLGMSANVWNNLRSLGVKAQLQTVIGVDIPDVFPATGITYVIDHSRQTAKKTRILNQGRHVVRYDQEDRHNLSSRLEQVYLQALIDRIKYGDFHGVILQDYGKGLWTEHTAIFIDYCRAKKVPVFVDPYEGRPISFYDGAFLIKPNYIEAQGMLGVEQPMGDQETLLELRKQSGADWVVLTAAERGMLASTRLANGDPGIYRAKPEEQLSVDPTGAGDTALAVLTCMLLSGYDMITAMEAANKAAGLVIKQLGVGTVSVRDIQEYIEVH